MPVTFLIVHNLDVQGLRSIPVFGDVDIFQFFYQHFSFKINLPVFLCFDTRS